jgi:DNA-binding PucR family transcriptional regulator
VRYGDQGLLASVCRDRVLVESLQQLYIDPLSGGKDGGEILRETLRAYFEAGCNVSSAGAALEVHRQTVTSRLRAVEEMLGCSLADCSVELNLALRLAQFLNRPGSEDR